MKIKISEMESKIIAKQALLKTADDYKKLVEKLEKDRVEGFAIDRARQKEMEFRELAVSGLTTEEAATILEKSAQEDEDIADKLIEDTIERKMTVKEQFLECADKMMEHVKREISVGEYTEAVFYLEKANEYRRFSENCLSFEEAALFFKNEATFFRKRANGIIEGKN